MYTREKQVDQADPSAPNFGAPQFPKTKIQLPRTLTKFAVINVTKIGLTRPIDCR